MTNDFEHLSVLRFRLSNERSRLLAARNTEVALRMVFVAQVEKEIAGEIAFLSARGIVEPVAEEMTDDELLAALAS